jgi:hypothetical protein
VFAVVAVGNAEVFTCADQTDNEPASKNTAQMQNNFFI